MIGKSLLLVLCTIVLNILNVSSDSCSGSSTCRAETLFVMDSSGSIQISGWDNEVLFVNGVINGVSGTHTHFGIIEFDSDVNTIYNLCSDQSNCGTIQDALSNKGNLAGGTTNIGQAINDAINIFNSCDDPELVNVLILITDGVQSSQFPLNSCDFKGTLDSLGVKVFIVEIGGDVSSAIHCLVDNILTDIFKPTDFNDLNNYINSITTAVCNVDSCGFTSCIDIVETCGEDCESNYFQPSINNDNYCVNCQDYFGEECLLCEDIVGCIKCNFGYELYYDLECNKYKCKLEECGPPPTICSLNLNEANCPVECNTNPCNCNEDCQFCKDGVCHINGCDECESGYFKKNYNYPCINCKEYYGNGCMFCQDFNGCGQCKSHCQRVYNQDCQLWECICSPTSTPTTPLPTSPTPSPVPPTPHPTHPTNPPITPTTPSPTHDCLPEYTCNNKPCSCNESNLNCDSGQCHTNGCNQCKNGYWKLDYNHKCVSCNTFFPNNSCNFCQDFNGCGQCAQGYTRQLADGCNYYICV